MDYTNKRYKKYSWTSNHMGSISFDGYRMDNIYFFNGLDMKGKKMNVKEKLLKMDEDQIKFIRQTHEYVEYAITDFISENGMVLSEITVMELVAWTYQRTKQK